MATGSFGFNAGHATTSGRMAVNTPNTVVFGNVNLWLANTLNSASELRFYEAQNSSPDFPAAATNFTAFKAGTQSADITYILPSTQATATGQVLSNDGTGILSWATASGGGLSGGISNTIPKWTSATTLGNSSITDDGTDVTTSSNIKLTGNNKQLSFKGDGTGTTTFAAGTQGATNISYTLPTAQATAAGQVLTNNGSGALSWTAVGGGGLVNFVDAINTATPNTTIPVASLSAINASANVDVAFIPKGTGAILADIPDNGFGGAKRGESAVDLQMSRLIASQVASGDKSVIGGGSRNTASGGTSTVSGGSSNSSMGTSSSIGGGTGNLAFGSSSVVSGGERDTASGAYSVVSGGNLNSASGFASVIAGGKNNTADGAEYPVISGGNNNIVSSTLSSIAGGQNNTILSDSSTILGGASLEFAANADRSIGFNTGQRSMRVNTPNTALLGNVDLWLANNMNKASELRFFGPYQNLLQNDIPGNSFYTAFKAGTQLNNITYVLPTQQASGGTRVLANDGTGILSWININTGALTHFTESLNNVGVNATDPVVILSATNAASNVDFVLLPKGNGSILADIPGTGSGGNKRGAFAIDFQLQRASQLQVASGLKSVISGGENNTASGFKSVVSGGHGNSATAENSVVSGGDGNTASFLSAVVSGGESNTASGDASVVSGGLLNQALSTFSNVSGGNSNSVKLSGRNSAVVGGSNNIIGHDSNPGGRYSTIAGGNTNLIRGDSSFIAGGAGLELWGNGTFGFNSMKGSASNTLKIASSNTAVFGNVDLWLANTSNRASELRFFEAQNPDVSFYPSITQATNYTAFKAGSQTADITYTLPVAQATAAGQVLTNNGSGILSWATSTGGVTNVSATTPLSVTNPTTTPNITISDAAADGTTKGAASFAASDFNATSGNISIDYANAQAASTSTKGFLTSTDWNTFNNKQNTLTLGTIAGTSPVSITGGTNAVIGSGVTVSISDAAADGTTKGAASFAANDFNATTGNISIDYANAQAASTSTKGFLTSTDWNTFNNKQNTLTLGTIAGTSPVSITGGTNAVIGSGVTVSISDAAADGTTKGAASFAASDFNATSGNISIDYANAQAASTSTKGFLTSTDWNTFNNKQSALSGGTTNAVTKWTSASAIGNSSITDDGTDVATTSNLKLVGSNKQLSFKGDGTGTTTFAAGTQGAANITYTLPTAQATAAGQVLTNDGAGALSWTTASGGGLSGGVTNTLPKWSSATTLGNSSLSDDGTDVSTTGNLKLIGNNKLLSFMGNSTGVTTFAAGAQGATNINYTLPTSQGPTGGAVLVNNGSGALSWQTIGGTGVAIAGFSVGDTTPAAGGTTSYLKARGTATHMNIALIVKGDGALTTSVSDNNTGPFARGKNSVDWQTKRSNANQVAQADYSVIAGGQDNRVQVSVNGESHNVIGGGFGNLVASNYNTIAGGRSNLSVGNHAAIGGGKSNRAGTFGTIPGGLGMTQEATRSFGWNANNLGETANMTIPNSFSNIAVFGNADMWLANTNNIASALRFYEPQNSQPTFPAVGTNFTAIKAGTQSADITYILPTALPTANGQLLASTTTGTMSWQEAPHSVESIRVLRGEIAANGAVNEGSGFTVNHVANSGVYTITITSSFSDVGTPVASIADGTASFIAVNTLANGSFNVNTFNNLGAATDKQFTFIVTGPR